MAPLRSHDPDRVSGSLALLSRARTPAPALRDRAALPGPTRWDVYERPDVYDMEYEGDRNDDAHFFARLLARRRPRRVLELGCGTGRVLLTLAAALPMAEVAFAGRLTADELQALVTFVKSLARLHVQRRPIPRPMEHLDEQAVSSWHYLSRAA